MADVAINPKGTNGTNENNGSIVVSAPKAAKRDAWGSNYVSTPGDNSAAMFTSKGPVAGVNNANEVSTLETKLTNRFDDPRYYSGDATG